MRHIGFVRQNGEEPTDESVKRLQQTGIPRKYIYVERHFRPDAEWLSPGDHLTVCSLRELGAGTEMLLMNLASLCAAGITLRALGEAWYDLVSPDSKALVTGLAGLCRTKKRASRVQHPQQKKRLGRPPGMTKATEAKCRECAELLATTNRTQGDILSSLHLSHRTWTKYKALQGGTIRKDRTRRK